MIYYNLQIQLEDCMDLKEYHKWLVDFYKKRNWYNYDSFIRCAFLTEEVGELAQAIRKQEIGRDRPDEIEKSNRENLEDIKEELGELSIKDERICFTLIESP